MDFLHLNLPSLFPGGAGDAGSKSWCSVLKHADFYQIADSADATGLWK